MKTINVVLAVEEAGKLRPFLGTGEDPSYINFTPSQFSFMGMDAEALLALRCEYMKRSSKPITCQNVWEAFGS